MMPGMTITYVDRTPVGTKCVRCSTKVYDTANLYVVPSPDGAKTFTWYTCAERERCDRRLAELLAPKIVLDDTFPTLRYFDLHPMPGLKSWSVA